MCKSPHTDSNCGPTLYKSVALPLSYRGIESHGRRNVALKLYHAVPVARPTQSEFALRTKSTGALNGDVGVR